MAVIQKESPRVRMNELGARGGYSRCRLRKRKVFNACINKSNASEV